MIPSCSSTARLSMGTMEIPRHAALWPARRYSPSRSSMISRKRSTSLAPSVACVTKPNATYSWLPGWKTILRRRSPRPNGIRRATDLFILCKPLLDHGDESGERISFLVGEVPGEIHPCLTTDHRGCGVFGVLAVPEGLPGTDVVHRLWLAGVKREENVGALRSTARWQFDAADDDQGALALHCHAHPVPEHRPEFLDTGSDAIGLHGVPQLALPDGKARKCSPSSSSTVSSSPMFSGKGLPCLTRARSSVSGAPACSRISRPVTGEWSNVTGTCLPSTSTWMW